MNAALAVFFAFVGIMSALVLIDSALTIWRNPPDRIHPMHTSDAQMKRLARRIERANRLEK